MKRRLKSAVGSLLFALLLSSQAALMLAILGTSFVAALVVILLAAVAETFREFMNRGSKN